MADQKKYGLFWRLFKVFQNGIGAAALKIIGCIDDDNPIFGNGSLILKQWLQCANLIDLYIAGQFMLFQGIDPVVPCPLLFLVAFWSATENSKIGVRTGCEKMSGFIVLNVTKYYRLIARIEKKMSGLLRKGCFAQSLITCQDPGMVELVFSKRLTEYLPGFIVT
ncbi:MAG: hypothetical protein WBM39_08515 [Parasphingorhabdus sp.]